MAKPNAAQREVLLAELELHKAEFSALREEILQSIEAERQSLNLTLIAIGAGLGAIPFISDHSRFVVLLLLPFVFHVILWDMLNTMRGISYLSDYLTGTLIQRVNAILDELGSDRHEVVALGWEIHLLTMQTTKMDMFLASLTPTRHWMPILAIAALLIAYGVVVNTSHYSPGSVEIGLFVLNLALLIYAGIRDALSSRHHLRQADKFRRMGTMDAGKAPQKDAPSENRSEDSNTQS